MKRMLMTAVAAAVNLYRRSDPVRLAAAGYFTYIGLGWLALCLPWSLEGPNPGWLDHLFTAASAVSTTGLVTVSTQGTYSPLGEWVVLVLIQAGGLGYMTWSSFILLAFTGQLAGWREGLSRTVLSLPAGFEVRRFLWQMTVATVAIEGVGALGLAAYFHAAGAANPLWMGVFHSVSAFCTAGLGLYDNSFEDYRGHVGINGILLVLSYLGAVGFIVIADVWEYAMRRRPVTLTTKVILVSTAVISILGTLLVGFDEPALQNLPAWERWLAAWFQVATASTTVGFNTVPIGGLSLSTAFLLTIVMMIGASPAGTGGGIKTTTVTALWAVMMGALRRSEATVFWHREIPWTRVRTAVASAVFYGFMLAAGIYTLALSEPHALGDLIFEATSALGTVGLSRGITGSLTTAGKITVIALMIAGRIGPLALALAMFPRARGEHPEPLEELAV